MLALGSLVLLVDDGPRKRKPYPKPTPPPPASPIYHDEREPVPTEAEIAREAETHVDRHVAALERAIVGGDRAERDIQVLYVMPELMQVAPDRVTGLFATLKPGEPRDFLRTEVTRQLVMDDADAAVRWIGTLADEAERRDSARVAVRELAPLYPDEAARISEALGLGGNDVASVPSG